MMQENMNFGGGKYGLEDILRNQSAMAQAGATSEDLRGDLSGRAAAAQQYGIQGAAGILGKISGAGAQDVSTDDAFSRLLTVAVKNGVDLSTMPQELNRFATIATELATQGGGFSQRSAEVFAAGITDMGATSMQGAKGFAEDFRQRAGAAGGLEGQIGYGFLLGSQTSDLIGEEAAGKLKEGRLASVINTLTAEELQKNPVLSKGYAAQLGIEEDALVELVAQKDLAKGTRTERQQESLAALGEGIGDLTGEGLQEYLESDEGSQKFTEAFTSMRLARGAGFKADATGRATITGLARLARGGQQITEEDIESVQAEVEAPRAGALEEVQRSRATGDVMQMQNLQNYIGEIERNAAGFSEGSARYNEALQVFINASKEGGEAMSQFKEEMKSALEAIRGAAPQDPSNGRTQPKGASGSF